MIEDAKLPASEQRRVTLWRALVAIYCRVEAGAQGRQQITDEERRAVVDRWSDAMRSDFALLCDVMERARLAGVEDTHQTLQRIEAQDPDLLEDAVAWATEQAIEEEREHASGEGVGRKGKARR